MIIDRYKYTNKDLDITNIDILGIDNITDFIELDKSIGSRNYVDNDIISLSLKENKDIRSYFGKIKGKIDDNYICSIESIKKDI